MDFNLPHSLEQMKDWSGHDLAQKNGVRPKPINLVLSIIFGMQILHDFLNFFHLTSKLKRMGPCQI